MVVEELSGRPRVRGASPGGLLLLALTVLGLFAMHGLQATASPAETHPTGIAITMPVMGHPAAEKSGMTHLAAEKPTAAHPADAMPTTAHPAAEKPEMAHPAAVRPAMGHPAADAGPHGSLPSHDAPGHRHPGGGMCLALLVMAALLVLAVVFVGRGRGPASAGRPGGRGNGRRGRAPPSPSIFRLSVLRL